MQYASLWFDGRLLLGSLDWVSMIILVLIALPNMCCTSNIMLANNICDVERDVQSKRYTLPYYIGQKKALLLYYGLYGVAYLSIVLTVIVGVFAGLLACWRLLRLRLFGKTCGNLPPNRSKQKRSSSPSRTTHFCCMCIA